MVLDFPDDYGLLAAYPEADGWCEGRSQKLSDAAGMLGIHGILYGSGRTGVNLETQYWVQKGAMPHIGVTPTGHLLFDVEEIQALTGRTTERIHSMMERWCKRWDHPANDFPEPPNNTPKLVRVS
jgi:hypothetical protein